ncbi:hypothetical protein H4F99_06980 [Lysobacter sp. SG-8]|uniref:DUF2845 domain-containing protein n=1 Tax=Marilutibacter penaei TaxID=2759900 RepID=A0A7W3U3G2_9GAMM|nr:hypothetical protein [Lysobacter penaei]MBB1088234.1 hypothetical protein [Lysobacter penaei]
MHAKFATLVLATMAAFPAAANDDPVGTLSDVTGLSERKVQMVLGNRTAFAEHRYSYQRSLDQFTRAIGAEKHQRLMDGEPVVLVDRQGQEVVVQLSPSSTAREAG